MDSETYLDVPDEEFEKFDKLDVLLSGKEAHHEPEEELEDMRMRVK